MTWPSPLSVPGTPPWLDSCSWRMSCRPHWPLRSRWCRPAARWSSPRCRNCSWPPPRWILCKRWLLEAGARTVWRTHVGERLLGLGHHSALDDLHGVGHEADLARDVEGVAHLNTGQHWQVVVVWPRPHVTSPYFAWPRLASPDHVWPILTSPALLGCRDRWRQEPSWWRWWRGAVCWTS